MTHAAPADEPAALAALYSELRGIAAQLMASERRTHTLQPTALVHEVWIKLRAKIDTETVDPEELRRRFLGLAARGMRQVLIDYARKRQAVKRGASAQQVTFFEPASTQRLDPARLLDLEAAIEKLEQRSERLARMAELRLFAGLSPTEAAAVLQVSKTTAVDDWALARAMLSQYLNPSD